MAERFAQNSLPGLEEERPLPTAPRYNFDPPVIRKPSLLVDFLRKDFPYRNIQQKKEAKREGTNPDFVDDRVEKYKLFEGKKWKGSLDAWEHDSKNLAASL